MSPRASGLCGERRYLFFLTEMSKLPATPNLTELPVIIGVTKSWIYGLNPCFSHDHVFAASLEGFRLDEILKKRTRLKPAASPQDCPWLVLPYTFTQSFYTPFEVTSIRRSPNEIRLTSICRQRCVVGDLDKFLERQENRRSCRRFHERNRLVSILNRYANMTSSR